MGSPLNAGVQPQEQFKSIEQQHEAATQGMWIFLATEILFFGGIFLAYFIYRRSYSIGFERMSEMLDSFLGTLNTAILLTSSLTMALSVRAVQLEKKGSLILFLVLTLIFGVAFLTIKGFEYSEDFKNKLVLGPSFPFHGLEAVHMEMFLLIYYVMTLIHAVHLLVGICLVSLMVVKTVRSRCLPALYSPIEVIGLYWHFVDVVWLFLYPLLYLAGRPHI